jgi:hypothetical protein
VTNICKKRKSGHLPGMYNDLKLPPPPPPLPILKDSIAVRALRDEYGFFVSLDYYIEGIDEVGPCEADAIFRVFEGPRAPPLPLSDEDRSDLLRRRRPVDDDYDDSYEDRTIDIKDVRRVCKALCEPDVVESEVQHFIVRFGMLEYVNKTSSTSSAPVSSNNMLVPAMDTITLQDMRERHNNEDVSGGEEKAFEQKEQTEIVPEMTRKGSNSAAQLFRSIDNDSSENTKQDIVVEEVGDGDGEEKKSLESIMKSTQLSEVKVQKKRSSIIAHRKSLDIVPVYKKLTLRDFKTKLQAEATSRSLNKFDAVFLYFEDPTSSRLSLYIAQVVMLLIVVSAFAGVVETMPEFKQTPSDQICKYNEGCISESTCDHCEPKTNTTLFRHIEVICTCCFTVEYIIRLCVVAFSNFGSLKVG